ncbi:Bax inhibitor 1 [Branchiostoma belcheri]|nr:Bax inhibitor 1 [Branchiostoma belcheri]
MGRKLRHVLIFLLIILKEPNIPEADCSCKPSSSYISLSKRRLTSIPQDLHNNNLSVIPRSLLSMWAIELAGNPWQCDFGNTENNASPSAHPVGSTSATQPLGNPLESANKCYNAAGSSRYHWFFKRNGVSTADPAENTSKTRATLTTPLAITSGKPEYAASLPLPVLISSVCGSVAGIVVIGITIWYKTRARHPPLALNPNSVFGNKTTATETTSDDDHPYEQGDNRHDQTGQRQSQAITESNTNTTETVITSADDQTGQGQSQTSVDDSQYEDIDAPCVKTRRAQSQAITESNIKTTATVMASGQDQTGQGQSQAIVESNTNTTATVSTSGDDQTGQGQCQAVTESLDARNLLYGTEPTASEHNCVYKAVTQSQTITNTAVVMTSGHDQTGQSQYVAIAESLDERNISYGTGLTASQLNSQYKTATVMTSGHDNTRQGQSQANTGSNTNTTATVMASGHDQTGQGQSQTNTQSPTVANLSRNEVLIAALQPNPMYTDVGTPSKNPESTEDASIDDQTGQDQSQANMQSLKVGNLAHNEVLAALQPNPMYTDVGTPSKNPESTEDASIDDQTGQDQSQANMQSLKVGNLAHNEVLAALKPNPMYTDVKTPPKDEASTEMASIHDQTEQKQSQANIQSLKVGNLSHNEVLAALKPNPMYVDARTPPKDEASTEMASIHDQTEQDQSQANIQSLKVGNLSHNEVLAALKPNPMYTDVKTPPKDEASTEMASIHDQTEQDQSQANIQSLKVGNLSHNEVLAALNPNPMYVDVRTPPKDEASTEMASIHDQTEQDLHQSQANIQSLKVGNLSHNEVLAALNPNPMYVDVRTPPKDEASTEMASIHDQTEQDQSQANIQSLKVGNLSHNEVLAALQPDPMYVGVKTPPKDEASTEMAGIHD